MSSLHFAQDSGMWARQGQKEGGRSKGNKGVSLLKEVRQSSRQMSSKMKWDRDASKEKNEASLISG